MSENPMIPNAYEPDAMVARPYPEGVPTYYPLPAQSALQPQDHLPPKQQRLTGMVRGVQVSIDPRALADWNLLETVGGIQSGDQGAMLNLPGVFKRLVGEDAYAAIKLSCSDPEGFVSSEQMATALGEVFSVLDPTRRSPDSGTSGAAS